MSSREKPPDNRINPLDSIRRNHKFHLHLCDAIEEVADSLRGKIDKDRCVRIVDMLPFELSLHHKDDELGLFPLLEKRSKAEDDIHQIIDELEREHLIDADRAAELLIPMSGLGSGQTPKHINLIGYIFRGFVEAYRRHLMQEINCLLPLAHKRLLPRDLDTLKLKMVKHRNSNLVV